MAMIYVNGSAVKCPSKFTFGLQDISLPDAGRLEDGTMEKMRVCQKRKIDLEWNGLTWAETASIMSAFNPEYISVTYPDMMSGGYQTRQFYVGDRTAPVVLWFDDSGHKVTDKLAFNIIEV